MKEETIELAKNAWLMISGIAGIPIVGEFTIGMAVIGAAAIGLGKRLLFKR